ncbi:hypothetical protein BDW02DRAFT_565879 [Decorospora gaudefroyi]|uniref:Uncharacterized protein n=1 Tax=Decorospora gaudefroyi TaxID=184978 RepID=A0A6A5KKE4_9PLEO|nr:hypothetical protein BDW02DRAFT_565879 [Decorospora gaudefroyi]
MGWLFSIRPRESLFFGRSWCARGPVQRKIDQISLQGHPMFDSDDPSWVTGAIFSCHVVTLTACRLGFIKY